jgi:two-component system, OmpR family, response regulator
VKVLVIDDNSDIIEALSICLDDLDLEYKIANSGKDGLNELRHEHYDLVLLDLAIPEFSGYDVLEALRNDGTIKSQNIVISTASSVVEKDKQELMALGAKDVLPKPYSLKELKNMVDKFNLIKQ